MRRKTWTLAAAALAAVLGLVLTGCSGATDGHAGTDSSASTRSKAVKFAGCMREHGVEAFPDPDASGVLTIDEVANGSSVDTSSASFAKAIRACRKLQPPGFTGRRRTTQQQQAALRFAQCVRDHGVKDFPDPTEGEPLVDTNHIPSANQKGGMSILNAAMHACGKVYADRLGLNGP
jgi:hypothetical protein